MKAQEHKNKMKRTYVKDGVTVIEVENQEEGIRAAFDLLKRVVDEKTLLFLSGGTSPLALYKLIADDKFAQIKPGAAATIDEHWGPPGHKASNEAKIGETGLYDYFKRNKVEIHTILHSILNRAETEVRYNNVVQGLMERYHKSVAIMGERKDSDITITPGLLSKINTHIILANQFIYFARSLGRSHSVFKKYIYRA